MFRTGFVAGVLDSATAAPRLAFFLQRITGPKETNHEDRSLSVAGTLGIADGFRNPLQPS